MIFELRNGSFAYNKKDYILERHFFHNKIGRNIGTYILGRNGIGKTTLVKCILHRIQQLQEGNIYINNKLVSPHR